MKTTEAVEKKEREFSWDDYSRSNASALESLHNRATLIPVLSKEAVDSESYKDMMVCLWDSLFRLEPKEDDSSSSDFKGFGHLIEYIQEARQSNLFTNEEANALCQHVASMIVHRRFNRVFRGILPLGEQKHWFCSAKKFLK